MRTIGFRPNIGLAGNGRWRCGEGDGSVAVVGVFTHEGLEVDGDLEVGNISYC